MKYIHFCIIILFVMMTKAQNWQPFQVDSLNYFINNYGELNGYRLDSVKSNEYYGHKGVFVKWRRQGLMKAVPGNWFALRMKLKNNKLLFIANKSAGYPLRNKVLDALEFRDELFDTLYFNANEGNISANKFSSNSITVGKTEYLQLSNNIYDSVKYFTFKNLSVSSTICISKNFGVIQWLGNTKRMFNIPLITNKKMHDYKVGDVVQFMNYVGGPPQSYFINREIMGRKDSASIVIYRIRNTLETYKFDGNIPRFVRDTTIVSLYNQYLRYDDKPYYKLQSCGNKLLIPDEVSVISNNLNCPEYRGLQSTWIYLLNDRIEVKQVRSNYNIFPNDSNVYESLFDGEISMDTIFNSCTFLTSWENRRNSGLSLDLNIARFYCKTECCNSGLPHYFLNNKSINTAKKIEIVDLKNGWLKFANTENNYVFKVFDCSGKEIKCSSYFVNNNYVFIGNLANGIFVIQAHNKFGNYAAIRYFKAQ